MPQDARNIAGAISFFTTARSETKNACCLPSTTPGKQQALNWFCLFGSGVVRVGYRPLKVCVNRAIEGLLQFGGNRFPTVLTPSVVDRAGKTLIGGAYLPDSQL